MVVDGKNRGAATMTDGRRFSGYFVYRHRCADPNPATRVEVGEDFWRLPSDERQRFYDSRVPCSACSRLMPFAWGKPIYGRPSETMQCDPRCWNAVGDECVCSCSGSNHGSGVPVASLKQTGNDTQPPAAQLIPPGAILSRYPGRCRACGRDYASGAVLRRYGYLAPGWIHARPEECRSDKP